MRRAVVLVPIAALALAGCGGGGDASAGRPSMAPYTVPADLQPTPEPVEAAPTTEAPIGKPTVYTGSGDDVVKIEKPVGADVVAVTVKGNSAGRYFGVSALDGDQDQLVNTTEPYKGTTLMDGNVGGTTTLQVQAVGSWSISIADIRSVPQFDSTYSGKGDAVLIYQGVSGVAAIKGNGASRYFGVDVYGSDSNGSVVNTTDPYAGNVPWPAGPALVVVKAVGGWSITVS